ncbi:hypothetical protein PDJAM_G00087670 [Pangasius djambal]|uniref:Uncharacterized protein n=1 Tax=Pangasius djambal TaxID=1691987 RepID=A0ACC5Z4X9_9TELE|nr:hypothetical protein [Pangasius djambal]
MMLDRSKSQIRFLYTEAPLSTPDPPLGQKQLIPAPPQESHSPALDTQPLHPAGQRSECQGEVEIYFRQDWRRVLLDSWSLSEASVLCRQLGCGSVLNYRSSPSTTGHKHMCVTDFSCSGSEAHLGNCSSAQPVNCSSGEQLYITCSGPRSIRLVGSGGDCAGRLEVFHSGSWGTVCDDSWDIEDAQVVCRQLQCGEALRSSVAFHEGRVRLSGGSECQGEVEIYFRQDWRRVLLDSWSLSEASVLCRQLGCGSVLNYRSSPSTTEHKHMCVTGFSCSGSEAHLANCSSVQPVNCGSREQLYITCSDPSSIRLVGSGGDCAGRLEVFHSGSWGTVCDDSWDIEDAQVVCRQLQCGEALSHTEARLVNGSDSCSGRVELQYLSEWGTVCAVGWDKRAADVLCAQLDCRSAVAVVEVDWFGEGSGHIWADVFDCQGNETHLSQCGISSWSRAACSHKHDAGVICNGSSVAFHEGRVRLSGESECQGEVEIYFRQDWRRVLLDSWSLSEASVLCRQLGCGSVLNYRSSPSTTEHKHMCVTGFSCSGSEAHLGNCSSAQPVNCGSGEQLYITCSVPRSIRLVGSGGDCAGRLEVFHSGSWGTVCDDSWDIEDAQVVCRQLQCGEALRSSVAFHEGRVRLSGESECQGEVEIYFRQDWRRILLDSWSLSDASVVCRQLGCGSVLNYRSSPSTTEHKHMCVTGFSCSGSEAHLGNCSSAQPVNCSSGEQLYITCSDGVRLLNGGSRCAGRVEVLHDGHWGTVCDDDWDMREAAVVCRELRCGEAVNVRYRAHFGRGSGPIWMNDVRCSGSESTLKNCSSAEWGKNYCDHGGDAGVTCSDSVRLVNGGSRCAGRVEVLHDGQWGTVCGGGWDMKDAAVVCRELRCGEPVNAPKYGHFGPGSGPIWMDEVACKGSESTLKDCGRGQRYACDHGHDAGVTCSGKLLYKLL